jgi:hypothetical protein
LAAHGLQQRLQAPEVAVVVQFKVVVQRQRIERRKHGTMALRQGGRAEVKKGHV